MKSRGFTLFELMIVVAIVGLLATSFLVSSGNVRKKSRDNKRKADLLAIQSALELYFAQNKIYPANCSSAQTQGVNSGSQAGSTGLPAGLSQSQKNAIWPRLSQWISHANNFSTSSTFTTTGCPNAGGVQGYEGQPPYLTPVFISSLPVDPINSGSYVYRYRSGTAFGSGANGYTSSLAARYEVDALLEVDTASMANDGGNCNGPPSNAQYRYELFSYDGNLLPCP